MRKDRKRSSKYEKRKDESLFSEIFEGIKGNWYHVHTRGRKEPLCAYVNSLHRESRSDAYILVYLYYPPSRNWNTKHLKAIMDLQIWTKIEDQEKISMLNNELTKMLLRS